MSPGRKALPATAVLDRRDQHAQAQRQAQRHDHPRKAQHGGRAAHVLFHQPHRGAGLEVQPAGVETHALADQRQRRAGLAPAHVDQARRAGRGAADRVDHREVLLQQVVARGDLDRRRRCRRPGRAQPFQLVRPHVVGRRVDQVAGQRLARRDRLDARGIDALGRDQAGPAGALAVVAVEAVAASSQPSASVAASPGRQAVSRRIGAARAALHARPPAGNGRAPAPGACRSRPAPAGAPPRPAGSQHSPSAPLKPFASTQAPCRRRLRASHSRQRRLLEHMRGRRRAASGAAKVRRHGDASVQRMSARSLARLRGTRKPGVRSKDPADPRPRSASGPRCAQPGERRDSADRDRP